MASPSERRRNNIRAGIFVLVTVLIAMAITVQLAGLFDTLLSNTTSYTVRYPIERGVRNLKPGGEVRVGGVKMGRVDGVEMQFPADGPPEVLVQLAIERPVVLHQDAAVRVRAGLIGSDTWVDIMDVGDPARPLGPGDILDGRDASGMVQSILGARGQRIIENAGKFSEFLARVPDEYERRVAPTLDDARVAAGDIREVAGDLRERRWPVWADSVDRIMAWSDDFTVELSATLADGRAIVTDMREPLQATLSNAETLSGDLVEVSGRLKNETVDRVHAFLERGTVAVDETIALLEEFRGDYQQWSNDTTDALANARLASQQLKLGLIELRRGPWKLLYRPATSELEHELLYDAARSFAMATADLRAASDTTRDLLATYGDRVDEDEALRERVRRNLEDPLANYERAQERLLGVLYDDYVPRDAAEAGANQPEP